MRAKAILIDGMNLCHRHFHLRKNDKDAYKDDIFVGFYHGVFNSIRFMRKRYPSHTIYVLWDSETRKRYTIKPDYKKKPIKNKEAQAKKLEERKSITSLLPGLKELFMFDGIHQAIAEGYEADDIADHMVKALLVDSNDIILWTADQDWAQLIQPRVRWVNTSNNNLIYDEKSFEEHYKYPCEGIAVFKSLTGDKSDNIKGIFKFPKKVAAQLASRTSSIEGLFYDRAILNDVDEKWKIEIKDNATALRMNFQLIQLYKNIQNLIFTEGVDDKGKLYSLFEKYHIPIHNESKRDRFYKKKMMHKKHLNGN